MKNKEQDFWVECNVCKQHFKNWTGSTPCCGSIAYMIENDQPTNKVSLYVLDETGKLKPTTVNFNK
jgi:hypothetical protein